MMHSFRTKTFTQPTYCGYCKQLLWGLIKQGLQCKECGEACHFKCKDMFKHCSKSIPTRFLDDDTRYNKDSIEQVYFQTMKTQLQQTRLTIMTPDYIQHATESALNHVQDILFSEKFQTMVANAALNQDRPVTEFLKKQPPLNPQTTTKNFTRFVSRVGPIFKFRDRVMLLLSWEKPLDTWISLFVYCLVCLYPKLILFIPQSILIYLVLSKHAKAKKNKNKKIKPDPLPKRRDEKKEAFSFPLYQPDSASDSPEYLRNLQNIQNSMGDISDAYDWIVAQSRQIDWSSESQTAHMLQCLAVLVVLMGPVALFVSLRIVFLSAGLSFYANQTRFVKCIVKELTPYMLQSGKRCMRSWRQWYLDLEASFDRQSETGQVSVIENQMWVSDYGYVHDPHAPWSSLSGLQAWSAKQLVKPPRGYRWKGQDAWIVDQTGPWVDDDLNIEICVSIDKYGWVYEDDARRLSMPNTRRRRWTRLVEKVK
ncbi:hypothetical protein G6F16_002807 [Rhizopus arrhizus]|nr:hypothetical protein G6F24_002808 [Rhizopus arrhizus]KAG0791805.1 hypothetical protein G6F21_004816 [Rhizopus arrhizus]KAG0797954.1 hypothetical protein G6F22_004593 [Rhizopus arrhizus]KAG0815389.1 hypothetical protein G6F20_004018 [Rhizopus arrhizus]KAG0841811.1 hypothetical protein G6F19_001340 [Rhizopus arrhizus]